MTATAEYMCTLCMSRYPTLKQSSECCWKGLVGNHSYGYPVPTSPSLPHMPCVSEDKIAVKHDNGKPDYSLLPLDLLDGVIRTFMYGEKKYDRYNFRKPGSLDPNRLLAACLRHLTEVQKAVRLNDEEVMKDGESGEAHLHHAISDLIMMVEALRQKGWKGV